MKAYSLHNQEQLLLKSKRKPKIKEIIKAKSKRRSLSL